MICSRCDGLTSRPHRNPEACLRALWSDVRTLETNEESIFRAIITWSGTVTRSQTGLAVAASVEAPKKIAKLRPERTRVLRDPSPCIVRGSSEVAQAAL